jgi:hypothetical protein
MYTNHLYMKKLNTQQKKKIRFNAISTSLRQSMERTWKQLSWDKTSEYGGALRLLMDL